MGAGNTLRWTEEPALRTMVSAVVDGVEACRGNGSGGSGGYILAFPPAGFMHSEQGDYGRSWFTQGLIEAGKAGNTKAFSLLRGLYDWFNNRTGNPVCVASVRTCVCGCVWVDTASDSVPNNGTLSAVSALPLRRH